MPDLLHLIVTGTASTQLLLRVVNLMAVNDHALRRVEAEIAGDTMVIRLDVVNPAHDVSEALANKLRSLVEVSNVASAYPRLSPERASPALAA